MNVLIIEDEPTAARRLERLLKIYDSNIQILDHLDSVETSVRWFQQNPPPELILMDIKLADGMCFEIFKQVPIEIPVIFCTAYDNFAIKAFKVNSVDYLLKPIDEKALHASLDKFRKIHNNTFKASDPAIFDRLMSMMTANFKEIKTRFLVKIGNQYVSVPTDKIALFYTENKIIRLVTFDNRQFFIDQSLDDLEQCLDPHQFFRTNRQEIISIHAIERVEQDYGNYSVILTISTKEKSSISRKRLQKFKSWLGG